MADCLIGLGSNLGNREDVLCRAVVAVCRLPHVKLVACSRWHETSPVGGPTGQGDFLNGAVLVETALAPESLLSGLQAIETELGRRRGERWGPRPIDLDLLLYDQLVLETPALVLPHPRMAWRRFVLEPAAEAARPMLHPTTGWTIGRLLDHLNTSTPYAAIAGPKGVGKTRLAEQLAQRTGAGLIADSAVPRTTAANRSGQTWTRELEFLEERTRLLAADLPQWSELDRLWVSDFWFDQCLAYARTRLAAGQAEAYRQRWCEARGRVVQPRLIVLLDPPGPRSPPNGQQGPGESHEDAESFPEISQELRHQTIEPDRGPVLHVTDTDPQRILNESLAALESMQ